MFFSILSNPDTSATVSDTAGIYDAVNVGTVDSAVGLQPATHDTAGIRDQDQMLRNSVRQCSTWCRDIWIYGIKADRQETYAEIPNYSDLSVNAGPAMIKTRLHPDSLHPKSQIMQLDQMPGCTGDGPAAGNTLYPSGSSTQVGSGPSSPELSNITERGE